MRHTLTLDDDLDARIAEACKESGKSFKYVVNALLRQGLAQRESAVAAPAFKIQPRAIGLRPGLSLVSISELEALMEERAYE